MNAHYLNIFSEVFEVSYRFISVFFLFYSIARLVVLIEHVLITSDFKKIKTHFV